MQRTSTPADRPRALGSGLVRPGAPAGRLLGALLVLLASSGAQLGMAMAAPQAERPSLEELLRRTREARDAAAASLRPQVEALLEELLAAMQEDDLRDQEQATEKLLDLGAPAATALVPYLRPETQLSVAASKRAAIRADLALELLRQIPTPAVVPALVDMTRSSSKAGTERAIRALGYQKNGGAPEVRLLELFETPSSPWRGQACAALLHLGGPEGRRALDQAFESDRLDLVRPALAALAEIGSEEHRPRVLDYLASGANAHRVAKEAAAYFSSLRDGLQSDEVRHFLQYVLDDRIQGTEAAELIDLFRGTDLTRSRRDVDDALERLSGDLSREVSEAAYLCLARLGDRKAKSTVLERYDREIDKAEDKDSEPWAERAQMYLRMDEFAEAVADYKKALKASEGRSLAVRRPYMIGTARAYARQGKLSAAADALEDALLGSSQKESLAADPDFAELVAHPRHGEVLR
jgi:tetratricopeptide (TPR) repeat protein